MTKEVEARVKIFQQAMVACHSSNPTDCVEWLADRIVELEKELKLWNDTTDARLTLYFQQKQKIADLEKENAELKTRVENQKSFLERIRVKFNLGVIERKKIEGYLEDEQLTKAKEIIKLGLRVVNTSSAEYMSEYEHKAEAFLKESE